MSSLLTCKDPISARIPTELGDFRLQVFRDQEGREHAAFALGPLTSDPPALVRIHSECFTGDVLGSLRCDCGPQLRQALLMMALRGSGLLIYLRQEGRGIGLIDKLKAYNLQDQGLDTVEANLELGHPVDAREYSVAARILRAFGLTSVELLTNNPLKVAQLQSFGIEVHKRVPLLVAVHSEGQRYLDTKQSRLHHWLDQPSPSPWPQGWDSWLATRSHFVTAQSCQPAHQAALALWHNQRERRLLEWDSPEARQLQQQGRLDLLVFSGPGVSLSSLPPEVVPQRLVLESRSGQPVLWAALSNNLDT